MCLCCAERGAFGFRECPIRRTYHVLQALFINFIFLCQGRAVIVTNKGSKVRNSQLFSLSDSLQDFCKCNYKRRKNSLLNLFECDSQGRSTGNFVDNLNFNVLCYSSCTVIRSAFDNVQSVAMIGSHSHYGHTNCILVNCRVARKGACSPRFGAAAEPSWPTIRFS